jgi:hypothetical protein
MFARQGFCAAFVAMATVMTPLAFAKDFWPPDALRSDDIDPWIIPKVAAEPSRNVRSDSADLRGAMANGSAGRSSEVPEARSSESSEAESEEDHIETDRDSFTPATTTVRPGRIVLETAYTFQDNRDVAETHSFPEFLARIGITKRLELRVGWNYEVGGAANSASGTTGDGGNDTPDGLPGLGPAEDERKIERDSRIAYGAKLALTEQEGFIPESAVILQGFTPTSGPSSTTTFVGTYVVGWKLMADWKLDAAVRYGTAEEEGDRFGNFAPSVVLRIPFSERWTAHAEWFGIFTDHREEDSDIEYFSPGVHYLVTPDLEVGVRVGWGLTDQSAKFFCNSGIGLRF